MKKYLCLNTRDEFYRVDISKVVYFKADGNYTNFVLHNGQKGIAQMNLSQMQSTLTKSLKESASVFARIGKRFIINLNYVYHIDVLRQRLVLCDGEAFSYDLAISKEALKKLKEMYVNPIKEAKKAHETREDNDKIEK